MSKLSATLIVVIIAFIGLTYAVDECKRVNINGKYAHTCISGDFLRGEYCCGDTPNKYCCSKIEFDKWKRDNTNITLEGGKKVVKAVLYVILGIILVILACCFGCCYLMCGKRRVSRGTVIQTNETANMLQPVPGSYPSQPQPVPMQQTVPTGYPSQPYPGYPTGAQAYPPPQQMPPMQMPMPMHGGGDQAPPPYPVANMPNEKIGIVLPDESRPPPVNPNFSQ